MDRETVLREVEHKVKGTTKLRIGDPSYFEEMENGSQNKYLKEITFNGNISAAPKGKLLIRKMHDNEVGFDYIDVIVAQGKNENMLDTYLSGKFYPNQVKKRFELGCDTAQFEIATKFGYDLFHTGADGFYGDLIVNKQYFGMILMLSFDVDLFDFEEIEQRMLKLFPLRKE